MSHIPHVAPALPTATGIHRHAGVNLENQIPARVEEQHAEGTHLLWNAARLGHTGHDAHGSDDALDGGVVGGPHHLKHEDSKGFCLFISG